MSTHGTLAPVPTATTSRRYKDAATGATMTKSFQYADPFYRYFHARHAVDDNNNRRHQPISLETSWGTKFWPNRQYAFFLALSELNANLAKCRARRFDQPEAQLEYRRALAFEQMTNTIGIENLPRQVPQRACNTLITTHEHVRKPQYAGAWNGREWSRIKKKYGQSQCRICKKRCRAYCKCNKAVTMCRDCYIVHILEV